MCIRDRENPDDSFMAQQNGGRTAYQFFGCATVSFKATTQYRPVRQAAGIIPLLFLCSKKGRPTDAGCPKSNFYKYIILQRSETFATSSLIMIFQIPVTSRLNASLRISPYPMGNLYPSTVSYTHLDVYKRQGHNAGVGSR